MGFDRSALQLFLNVTVITGVTSLALMWYLRRRDAKKAPVEFSFREEQPPLPAVSAQTPEPFECAPSADQDIRQYVARRSREWVSVVKTS